MRYSVKSRHTMCIGNSDKPNLKLVYWFKAGANFNDWVATKMLPSQNWLENNHHATFSKDQQKSQSGVNFINILCVDFAMIFWNQKLQSWNVTR